MTNESSRIARRSLIVAPLVALLPLLASCGGGSGGGSGGGVLGDLNTDLVITQNTTATEIRAKNLTINDGATVSSTGDMKIQTAGKVTLNGIITPGGGLTVISANGMDTGANAAVRGVKGHVIMVDNANLIPTDAQMDTLFQQAEDLVLGGPRDRSTHSRQGVTWRLIPYQFDPSARGYHIWVNVGADIKIGKPGQPYLQDMPAGKNGPNAPSPGGDTTNVNGSNGGTGGSVEVTGDSIEFNGNITYNLGNGGNGGDATATGCPATAKGGDGGKCGTGRFTGDNGVENNGTITVNYGHGGDGGNATSTSTSYAGQLTCPVRQCSSGAEATGGKGGDGPHGQAAKGNTSGGGAVTVNGNRGGNGGTATATGGAGGNSSCCPAGIGGTAGPAKATGGNGGPSRGSAGSGFNVAGGFVGGQGGNATANGGKGGNGASCCTPPQPGGPGAKGGNANAKEGTGGTGTSGNGANGTPAGAAGDGGNGGDGNGPGAGGAGGVGTGIPNGNAGNAGSPCAVACTPEQEPNDDEFLNPTSFPTPANINDKTCGTGTLANVNDKDHWVTTLTAGTYVLTIDEPPAAPTYYLHIGNNGATTPPIGQASTIEVGAATKLVVGFFGGTGNYKFTLKRTQ